MVELTDKALEEHMEAIRTMPTPSFFPKGAREAGKPFIERHHVAMGDDCWTVWEDASTPFAANLTEVYKATDEYLYLLEPEA